MSLISKQYTFTVGATIIASEHNANFDTIYNDYNGNITNANMSGSAAISYSKLNLNDSVKNSDISSSAAIVDSKLATISTAGKVTGDALTSLANIPSGAGNIPRVNSPSGSLVQTIYSTVRTLVSGTGIIPFDDTIPQFYEGKKVMSANITPVSSTNYLLIDSLVQATSSVASKNLITTLFLSNGTGALAASCIESDAGGPVAIPMTHYMVSGTTNSLTFNIRLGSDSSTTLNMNGSGGSELFGGVSASSITVREITP